MKNRPFLSWGECMIVIAATVSICFALLLFLAKSEGDSAGELSQACLYWVKACLLIFFCWNLHIHKKRKKTKLIFSNSVSGLWLLVSPKPGLFSNGKLDYKIFKISKQVESISGRIFNLKSPGLTPDSFPKEIYCIRSSVPWASLASRLTWIMLIRLLITGLYLDSIHVEWLRVIFFAK